jgi:hypothetical protein
MAVLWAVPVGVVLKWALTEGIARWQMATGTTLLEGWVTRLGWWMQWVFRTGAGLNTVLAAALMFFAFGGAREIMRLLA